MIEDIKEALKLIGIPETEYSIQSHLDDTFTLKYQYWRWLPDDKEKQLRKILKNYEVANDEYEDDDGDDSNGRPIIRRLYSYIITRKDGLEE